MSSPGALTTTSYAILSLLAVRPWSTYELTRQMDRSVGRMWPRAQSKLYEEPKKLVAHGLATARSEAVGQRSRTVYAITAEGREALAAWHREPGSGPVLEFEQLLKLSFAEHGTTADALATLAAARRWAEERNVENRAAAAAAASGDGRFPERLPEQMLVGRFLTDFYRLVADWADWATALVEQWPEDAARAEADRAQVAETAARADW
ncbi:MULTISPECIES: PadR family transcriptional regulator [unclassified Geodermatophilus]|uniref:PadR family transcriptional regulator n=1 Tax=unclassified Geodermatophilus TaxID=2637632 RepID=UPI003EEE10BB